MRRTRANVGVRLHGAWSALGDSSCPAVALAAFVDHGVSWVCWPVPVVCLMNHRAEAAVKVNRALRGPKYSHLAAIWPLTLPNHLVDSPCTDEESPGQRPQLCVSEQHGDETACSRVDLQAASVMLSAGQSGRACYCMCGPRPMFAELTFSQLLQPYIRLRSPLSGRSDPHRASARQSLCTRSRIALSPCRSVAPCHRIRVAARVDE